MPKQLMTLLSYWHVFEQFSVLNERERSRGVVTRSGPLPHHALPPLFQNNPKVQPAQSRNLGEFLPRSPLQHLKDLVRRSYHPSRLEAFLCSSSRGSLAMRWMRMSSR